ncbi:MAG TPA: bacteriohemerythrin [Candidatus Cloacimonadota bacterium]|nr:bacteriohemerythrin [Candidatus Cloacimonadota bacterium]
MAYLEWNNTFSVKIAEIDKQHQMLVSYINELHDAMAQGKSKQVMGELFTKLANYAVEHFTLEEKLMFENSYPDYISHKNAHTDFVKKVTESRNSFEAGKFLISIEVMNFLKDWLMGHIMGVDQRYSAFLNEKGIR